MKGCDLLITNARLVTGDPASIAGSIAVHGGRIVEIGADLAARYRAQRTLDARGAIVHAGFIDAHTHVSQYSARSALLALERDRLSMGHWKAQIGPADEVASVRLAMLDLLLSGYTGFVDPGTIVHTHEVTDAIADAGLRAWVTDPYVADRVEQLRAHSPELLGGAFRDRWPDSFAEATARIGGQLFHNQEDTPVHGFVGLYGEGTDSPTLYAHAVEVARANDVVVQKHLGYQPAMYAGAEKHLGCSPIRWLAEHDQLDRHSSFVHLNRLSREDTDLLATAGATCVWCPYGQLQTLSHPDAEPRMTQLVRSGAPVGLGSDIARAVNLDSLGSLAVAASTVAGNPVTAAEILRMRTVGAAASIGAADVGALEAGYRADLVIRCPSATQDLGVDASVEVALLGCRGTVRTVVVDGKVIFDDGIPTRLDAEQTVADARASVAAITGRLVRQSRPRVAKRQVT